MTEKLISVIIPAYNADEFIYEALQSVRHQTHQIFEIIVVDDGSSDKTANIVSNLATVDSRIIYIKQANGKQGKARNAGLRRARGEFVALLDADDKWYPRKLEMQLLTLEIENVEFVHGNADVLYEDLNGMKNPDRSTDFLGGIALGRYAGDKILPLLCDSNRIVTLTVLFRRKILTTVGYFEEELLYQNCEDYDLWLRMAKMGVTFYGMSETLGAYRRHRRNSTVGVNSQLVPALKVLEKNHRQNVINDNDYNRGKRRLTINLLTNLIKNRCFWQAFWVLMSQKRERGLYVRLLAKAGVRKTDREIRNAVWRILTFRKL